MSQVFQNGCWIRALSRWHNFTGEAAPFDPAGKLTTWVIQPIFWFAEAEPKAVTSADRAHFDGHIHSYTQALMGLLVYANATRDARLKQFVRDGYEYLRNFGIARIGLFGETCASADMTFLALKLSDSGVGDYWDDADAYIRNNLAERQIADAQKLQAAVTKEPIPVAIGLMKSRRRSFSM